MKKEFTKAFYILFAGEYAGEYADGEGYADVYTYGCADKNIGDNSSSVIYNNSPRNTFFTYND